MAFLNPTISNNCPRSDEAIDNPHISLPINYPRSIWPINYPISGVPISHSLLNQIRLPWSIYISNLALSSEGRMPTSDLLSQAAYTATDPPPLRIANDQNHKIDGSVDTLTDPSSEEARSDRLADHRNLIVSIFSEKIVSQNIVTDLKVTEDTITVYISPVISYQYARPDCQNPTTVNRYDRNTITVQGLAVQGKAVRYVVDLIRLYYVNDQMEFIVFRVDIPGIRRDIKITDEVLEISMYFIIDCNLSLRVTAQVLDDLYRIETSSSALDRWKMKEAEALPSIGQLIQQLNAKKTITQLHLDEYKATGTKNWQLCIKDEHGRLVFSIALKKRDAWHIKVILRWFRILGLKIDVFYSDFWLAYPPAIRAIYPKAEIQFDFFHVVQNIHRHLYKDFTAYRKLFKDSNQVQELEEAHKQLHKKLWQNRYLLFTNEENLDDKQRILLDQLIEEHSGTIVEQIVVFRWYLRDIFNQSSTYQEALEKLSILIVDGCAETYTGFTKSLNFLQKYFRNMATYLRVDNIQRNSLSECTVRTLRRIESIRQGFKSNKGRTRHLKLLIHRKYLRTTI